MRPLSLLKTIVLSAFVRPLSHLWPKDPKTIAFMPRDGQRYTDNVAHFFEALRASGDLPQEAYLLVADSTEVAQKWTDRGRKAFNFASGSLGLLLRSLRTSMVITDNWQWSADGRYSYFAGARKVQIWHGIPLKKVELSNLDGQRAMLGLTGASKRALMWLKGRHPFYDLVVATSPFFLEHAFRSSFRATRFVITGYPRNDFLLNPHSDSIAVDMDDSVLSCVDAARERGDRIVVYAPTFRDRGGTPFEEEVLDLRRLENFASGNALTIVAKLHPYVDTKSLKAKSTHVLIYDAFKDVAPLLKRADLLVTDYSSIFFDFLLLDRPIVFFPYDLERYFSRDRQFLFPYDEFTPGARVKTEEALFKTIVQELDSPDPAHQEARLALRDKSFQFIDAQASSRLWNEIQGLLIQGLR